MVKENEIASQAIEKMSYDALTANAKNKYDALVNHYGDNTLELINILEDRGVNSYLRVYANAEVLKTETDLMKINYSKLISQSFDVNVIVTIEQIVPTITDCRRKFKFEPILAKIKQTCLAELQKNFVVKPVFHGDDLDQPKNKRRIIGYIPVFDLTQLIEE